MSHDGIVKRLRRRTQKRNGELKLEAITEATTGALVTALTFGFVFSVFWVLSWFTLSSMVQPFWFALGITAVFLVAAAISAWRKVEPFAGLAPRATTSGAELIKTFAARAAGVPNVDPRYTTAGAAALLLSGPTSLLDALSTWAHRLPNSDPVLQQAAALLEQCQDGVTAEQIRDPQAADLLRRMVLIRVVTTGDSPQLQLTDRGKKLLEKTQFPERGAETS